MTIEIKTEEKLYAGKYKTIEDLEAAVIGKDKEYTKIFNELGEFKSKYSVPEDYQVEEGLDIADSELSELKKLAKQAGLTQNQFLSTTKQIAQRNKSLKQQLEDQRKNIGEEKLKLLDDYVTRAYPDKIKPIVLNHLIQDKQAMSEALDHRDKLLNTSIPGIKGGEASAGSQRYDGEAELLQAARESQADPRDMHKRDRYLKLAQDVGHARKDKK